MNQNTLKKTLSSIDAFKKKYEKDLRQERLFIESRKKIAVFEAVQLAFFVTKEKRTLNLCGEIVHITTQSEASRYGGQPGLGIHVPMKQPNLEHLEEFLGNLPQKQSPVAISPSVTKKPKRLEGDNKKTKDDNKKTIVKVTQALDTFDKERANLNLYGIMAISPDATSPQIKKAYRQLVRVYHPDQYFNRLPSDLTLRLEKCYQIICHAFEVLIEHKSRLPYDISIDNYTDTPEDGLRVHQKRLFKLQTQHKNAHSQQSTAFLQQYEVCMAQGDIKGAKTQLRLALSFEPFNLQLKNKLNALK